MNQRDRLLAGEIRVREQRARLVRLERHGYDTTLARHLLALLEQSVATRWMRTYRAVTPTTARMPPRIPVPLDAPVLGASACCTYYVHGGIVWRRTHTCWQAVCVWSAWATHPAARTIMRGLPVP